MPEINLWSIILAGGDGNRLRPFTERWFGRHIPKQYCQFSVNHPTMLAAALERGVALAGPLRTVTVVSRKHLAFSETYFSSGRFGHRVVQPRNCDTAAGIYLPLTYVRKEQSDATVVILPSDHYLRPEGRFTATMRAAARAAADLGNQIVLLGATPDAPEPDYGWILPGEWRESAGGRSRTVRAFVEKPDVSTARELMARGALWNTFAMAATVDALWTLGWLHVPDIMPQFENLERVIGTRRELDVLDAIYAEMPSRNFSSDVLEKAADRTRVMELDGVTWNDLGTPERLERTLDVPLMTAGAV